MINRKNLRLILLLVLISLLFGFVNYNKIFAQETQGTEECGTREECEAILKQYEDEIAKYEADITTTQKEKNTLSNKISILKNQIKKLELQISQSDLMVKDLTLQLKDTEGSIEKNSLKIEEKKDNLVTILRSIYEEDQKNLVQILLSENQLSGFFDNLMSLENLNYRNKDLLKEIKNLKNYLEDQKVALDNEKGDLESLMEMQQLQKQENEATKKTQENLLEITRGKESEYQKLLKSSQEKAAQIRARIFDLIGIPQAPTFGEAYDLSKYVEEATGIRPAFLLAVLTQESNIGKNVGQCFLTNTTTGEGVRIQTGKKATKTMKPGQNITAFLQIVQELGRDPLNTPVSCPMSFGWGGAMGPAQFIPSTWMIYKDRVKAITGTADPWSIRDSFIASALYLKDKGASSQNYKDEWNAAIAYFAGYVNLRYRFYGDSVMSMASKYESDIQEIESSLGYKK